MVQALREVQLPLLSLVLITAGLAKLLLRGPSAPDGAPTLDVLRHHRGLSALVALFEVGLGLALLITSTLAARVATVIWFVAAFWIVDELRTRRPEAGCGCFGALSTTRIGRRVLARPLLLAGAAITTLGIPVTGETVLRLGFGCRGLALVAEIAVVLALSPELGVVWARGRTPEIPCELRQSPLSETLAALHASPAWRPHAAALSGAEPVEVWRELCWRFVVYRVRLADRDTELVFAVSLAQGRHPEVRVALVDAQPGIAPVEIPFTPPPARRAPTRPEPTLAPRTTATAGFQQRPFPEDVPEIEDSGPNPLAPVAV